MSANEPAVSSGVDRSELPGVQRVAVDRLLPGDSPRLRGPDEMHAQTLAEVETSLPPILVHASTMRVIDGAHRVRAAIINGETHVYARIFHGSPEEAFLEAVRTNVAHGKPLSRRERELAAKRILASRPNWSDRAIADVCGVSAGMIASLRRRATEGGLQLNARVGRDGRVRPVDASEGRRRVVEVLSKQPDASLREIARQADVSAATARDVKARLRDGTDPVARRRTHLASVPEPADPGSVPASEPDDHLRVLREDTSLQTMASGLRCLQLFTERFLTPQDWRDIAADLPISRAYVVGDLARSCAKSWSDFADALQARARHH